MRFRLEILLKSDTTFGRGDGVAGLVDDEVQHDASGCPYLNGRTLKGMLVEECANLLFNLKAILAEDAYMAWQIAAGRLFGEPSSTDRGRARLAIGHAQLRADLRQAIASAVNSNSRDRLTREMVLGSFTSIRTQTAVDVESGAPKKETLRTSRVLLRNLLLTSEIEYIESRGDNGGEADASEPSASELDTLVFEKALLAASVAAFRRGGLERNRGRGELEATLRDADGNRVGFDLLKEQLKTMVKSEVLDAGL